MGLSLGKSRTLVPVKSDFPKTKVQALHLPDFQKDTKVPEDNAKF